MKILFYTAFAAIFAFTSALSVQSQQENLRDAELGDKPLCKICEVVVKGAVELLNKNETQVEVEDLAKKVCNDMTGVFKTECNFLVDKYGKEIIDHLVKTMDPAAVCSTIKLCSIQFETAPAVINGVSVQFPQENSGALEDETNLGSVECSICKWALKEIKDLVGKQKSKDEIEKIVKKICSVFPSKEKNSCDNLIDKYGDKIIDLIVKGTNPDTVCSVIQLC